jgi:hypothetical protein
MREHCSFQVQNMIVKQSASTHTGIERNLCFPWLPTLLFEEFAKLHDKDDLQ